MSTVKQSFGSQGSNLFTLSGSQSASSTVCKLTQRQAVTGDMVDVLVEVTIAASSGTIANDKGVTLYVVESPDGTTWPPQGSATPAPPTTATETSYTFAEDPATIPSVFSVLGFVPVNTQSQSYRRTFRLSDACSGALPPYWALIVRNYCGVSITTSCTVKAQPVYFTIV